MEGRREVEGLRVVEGGVEGRRGVEGLRGVKGGWEWWRV